MELVKLENVKKTYGRGAGVVSAINGVDLCITKSEFLSIWGPSGSGKSTLLNIIGLLDKPDQGRVVIGGIDAAGFSDKKASEFRNKTLGFIFQSFNLVPVLTAVENVMVPLQITGERDHMARKKALQMLEEVNLAGHAYKRPDEMSGGQRQRVAVARALVNNPCLVLADEPTANLDSVTGESIIALMKALNQKKGVTFVFSTHDSKLLNYASRNIRVQDGMVMEE